MSNYFNPYNNGINPGMNIGTQYVNRPKAKNTQPLTKEEIDELRRGRAVNKYEVTNTDLMIARCTHRNPDGSSALIDNEDGSYTCTICGTRFNMFDEGVEKLKYYISKVTDAAQTCKILWLDAPYDFAKDFYGFLELMKKLPSVLEEASANFNYHDRDYQVPVNGYTNNNFGMLNMMTGAYNPAYYQQPPMNMGQPVYQQAPMNNMGQPVYQQPMNMGQPVYQQAPMNNMGQPVYNNSSPFVANQPVYNNPNQFTPNQGQVNQQTVDNGAPVQPVNVPADPKQNEVVQTKAFTV